MAWHLGENIETFTLAASRTSDVLSKFKDVLLMVTIEGNVDAIGEVIVDGSNDRGKWYPVPFRDSGGTVSASYAVTAGLNTTQPFLVEAFPHARVRYVRTSGGAAATLSVTASEVHDA